MGYVPNNFYHGMMRLPGVFSSCINVLGIQWFLLLIIPSGHLIPSNKKWFGGFLSGYL